MTVQLRWEMSRQEKEKAPEKKRGDRVMHIIVQDLMSSIWRSQGATPAASLLRPAGMGTPSLFPPDAPMAPCWHLGMSLHKPESWLDRAKQARRDRASWLASAKYVFGETDVHYLLNTSHLWDLHCVGNGEKVSF